VHIGHPEGAVVPSGPLEERAPVEQPRRLGAHLWAAVVDADGCLGDAS